MISAIITCAGNGCRFGHNKLMANLAGKPVFIRTLEKFSMAKSIKEIIVAVRQDEMLNYKKAIKEAGLKVKVVIGGEQRHISSLNAIKKSKGKYVVIHDGARPLVSVSLIEKVCQEVLKHEAVMTAVEAHTCVKHVQNYYVKKCLPRSCTWLGQTPQAFSKNLILKAYKKALKDKSFNGMDDCEFVSNIGVRVKIIKGEDSNLKITFPHDLIVARHLFKKSQEGKNV